MWTNGWRMLRFQSPGDLAVKKNIEQYIPYKFALTTIF